MTKRIVFTDPDTGNLCVVIPSPKSKLTMDEHAEKTVPQGIPYRIVFTSQMPSDRTYRAAWIDTGIAIDYDMPKAREAHRNHIRVHRKAKLEMLDQLYMRALEAKDEVKMQAIANRKQQLRDATKLPGINMASDINQLKTVWHTELGPNLL